MQEIKIQVLGSGCATCKNLHKAVEEAVKKLNLTLEVEYSTDIAKIVELGAMSSPVFAINGEVVTSGQLPSNEEIEKVICEKIKGNSVEQKEAQRSGCSCENNC